MTSAPTDIPPIPMPRMTSTSKPRASRKPKASLPPAIAHELDVARAARMGVDISHMHPDERCKYPSKFCCNPRARKSTGKLHRFCEEHRSRANDNQKRWTNERRRHERAKAVADAASALCVDEAWMDKCKPILLPRSLISPGEPPSPTTVEMLNESDLPLSEDEIDVLMSMVASSEQSLETLAVEDAWLMTMLQDVEPPVVAPNVFDDLAIGALLNVLNCHALGRNRITAVFEIVCPRQRKRTGSTANTLFLSRRY